MLSIIRDDTSAFSPKVKRTFVCFCNFLACARDAYILFDLSNIFVVLFGSEELLHVV